MAPNDRIQFWRDPAWQSIGVIITVASIIASIFVTYDVFRRSNQATELIIEEQYSFSPTYFSESTRGRISLLVDDQKVEPVIVYSILIKNSGSKAILPTDHIEPLTISMEAPWELITVESGYSGPGEINVKWSKVQTNTFQMTPVLLNPGDYVQALVFLTNKELEEPFTEDIPSPLWAARIVDVSKIKITKGENAAEASGLGIFYASIVHRGWDVYWFGIIGISIFVASLFVGVKTGALRQGSAVFIPLLALLSALSFASSDVIVEVLIDRTPQVWFAPLFLLAQIILLLYFLSPMLWNYRISIRRSHEKPDILLSQLLKERHDKD